jgi:hypothetical protein
MRRVSLLYLLAAPLACTSWRPVTEPIPAFVATHQPGKLRLTSGSAKPWVAYHPQVVGDTLAASIRTHTGRWTPLHVPLDTLRQVEWRRPNVAKTVGLVLGVTFTLTAAALTAIFVGLSQANF